MLRTIESIAAGVLSAVPKRKGRSRSKSKTKSRIKSKRKKTSPDFPTLSLTPHRTHFPNFNPSLPPPEFCSLTSSWPAGARSVCPLAGRPPVGAADHSAITHEPPAYVRQDVALGSERALFLGGPATALAGHRWRCSSTGLGWLPVVSAWQNGLPATVIRFLDRARPAGERGGGSRRGNIAKSTVTPFLVLCPPLRHRLESLEFWRRGRRTSLNRFRIAGSAAVLIVFVPPADRRSTSNQRMLDEEAHGGNQLGVDPTIRPTSDRRNPTLRRASRSGCFRGVLRSFEATVRDSNSPTGAISTTYVVLKREQLLRQGFLSGSLSDSRWRVSGCTCWRTRMADSMLARPTISIAEWSNTTTPGQLRGNTR